MMPNSITDQTQVQGLPNKVYSKSIVQQCVSKNALEFLGRVLPFVYWTISVFLPKYVFCRPRKTYKWDWILSDEEDEDEEET